MRDLSQIQAQYVKGVGPGRAELLRRLGIRSVIDLLQHYPRRYEDRRQIRRISQLEVGRNETVRGKVLAVGTKRLRKALTIVQVALGDGSGTVYATWFNQTYMQSRFRVGQELILTGKVQRRGYLEIMSPEFEILSAEDNGLLNTGRIAPVYPLSEHLSQRAMRKIVHACIEGYAASTPELLEASLREECGLSPVSEAIRNIHFPDSPAALEAARRRLVFDEFLPMQLAIHLKRKQLAELPGSSKKGGELVRRFLKSLPFELTRAQERVIAEVGADMGRVHPMNRLLQGDVGSGKTVVAIVALLIALDARYQGVLMAPTEILAEQHWRTLDALLAPLGIRPYLLTGEMSLAEKAGVYEAIRSNSPLILVGTHAVLQGDVEFSRLGIVVVDEQHRFGVSQRAAIRSKGENPDFMVMTATPIPRTLALTLYGDLDVSVIDEMPPGRGTVVTRWVPPEKMGEAYAFVRAEALKGHQAYIIYPLVEESEKLPLNAARNMAASLSKEQFRDLRVGLIHGRMGREEREEVMRDFRAGRILILVATSVIEVGLDVPGACLMLVEHAERFGLSQLHQMRGRIGRGKKRSYFLFSGQPATEEGIKRLKALCATNDGFRIAEMDLELRGPGEFFSDRQHGGPDLRLADPFKDEELLKLSREIAARIAGSDRRLKSESHRALRELLIKKYSGKFFLGITG
jgi:ATP-dependent DNA helicase RecG